jgi:hypothetical protein
MEKMGCEMKNKIDPPQNTKYLLSGVEYYF